MSSLVPKLIGAHVESTLCSIVMKAKPCRNQRIKSEKRKAKVLERIEAAEKTSKKARKGGGNTTTSPPPPEEGHETNDEEEVGEDEEYKLVDFVKPLQEIGVDINGKIDQQSGEAVFG